MATQQEIDLLITDIETLSAAIAADVVNLNETIAAIVEADDQLAAMDAVMLGEVFSERFAINQKLVYTNEDQRKAALIGKQTANQTYQAMKAAKTTLYQTRAAQMANIEQNRNLLKSKNLLFQFYGGNTDDLNSGTGNQTTIGELPESDPGSFFFAVDGYATDATNAISNANEVRFFRFNLKTAIVVDALAFTANAPADEKVSFGIYSADGNNLLVDSGIISALNWAGANVLPFGSVTLSRGFYLFAWTANGANSTMKHFNVSSGAIKTIYNYGVPVIGKSQTPANDGALPSGLLGLTGLNSITIPAVKFFKS